MASKDVCEIRLVMATALTRRVKTVKRFPVQQPAANPCAGQPLPGGRGRIPVAGGHQAGWHSGQVETGPEADSGAGYATRRWDWGPAQSGVVYGRFSGSGPAATGRPA